MAIANEIYFDNEKGFQTLIEHLLEVHGVHNIQYLSGPLGNRDAIQRLKLFKETMEAHGIEVNDDMIFEGDFGYGSGKAFSHAASRTLVAFLKLSI